MGRKKKVIKSVLVITLILIIGAYIGISIYFSKVFLPNTWINSIYSTGKNADEINRELIAKVVAPSIVVYDESGKAYEIDLKDADFSFDYKRDLQKDIDNQNAFTWIFSLSDEKRYDVKPETCFDEDKLKGIWEKLPFVVERMNDEGIYEIRQENGEFVEYNGMLHRLDLDKAFNLLTQTIRDENYEFRIADEDCFVSEELTANQLETKAVWDKVVEFKNCAIVYDMGSEQIPLDSKVVSSFLGTRNGSPYLDIKGNLALDEKKIAEFVDQLCEEYDTFEKEREFQSTRGDVIKVKGVTYGTKINRDEEISYLMEALTEKKSFGSNVVSHIPAYEKEGYVRGKDDIGNTYIEIDMTEQKMYLYVEGELIVDTDIVTGCTSKKRGTPEGINFVYSKQRNRTLRGPGYASPVKYWMPVKGNIGLHDSSWRKEYGGDIYIKSGSHGCVNTPLQAIKTIYETVEIGTPVIMFY